jgi:hypothetical protein
MNDDDIHGISGAYAVDALDDDERARFEAHLAGCPSCSREVKSLQTAATELSRVTPVAPPASLRSAVLQGISQVRPLPPVLDATAHADDTAHAHDTTHAHDAVTVGDTATVGDAATAGATASLDPLAAPSSLDARRTRRAEPGDRTRRNPARWLVGVAAAAAIVTGGAVWHPWAPGQGQRSPQLTATQQVLQAKDAQPFEKKVGGSTVKVVRSNSLKKAVIVAANLPAIPQGKVYELWLLQGDKMVKAGFVPNTLSSTVLLQGDAATAAAAGITVEPAGGSLTPSQSPIVVVDFA